MFYFGHSEITPWRLPFAGSPVISISPNPIIIISYYSVAHKGLTQWIKTSFLKHYIAFYFEFHDILLLIFYCLTGHSSHSPLLLPVKTVLSSAVALNSISLQVVPKYISLVQNILLNPTLIYSIVYRASPLIPNRHLRFSMSKTKLLISSPKTSLYCVPYWYIVIPLPQILRLKNLDSFETLVFLSYSTSKLWGNPVGSPVLNLATSHYSATTS